MPFQDTIPGTATLDAVDSDIQATHDGKLDFVQKTLQQYVNLRAAHRLPAMHTRAHSRKPCLVPPTGLY